MSEKRRDPWFTSLFRNRNFVFYTLFQTISQLADYINHRALIFLVGLLAMNSPAAFANLTVPLTVPLLIFAPLAGIAVDRWNRKRVIIFSNLCCGGIVFLISAAALFTKSLWPVYGLVFLFASFSLFGNTAKAAVIPNIVQPSQLLKANSAISVLDRGFGLLGFVLADLLVAQEKWLVFGLSGWVSSLGLAGILFFMGAAAAGALKFESGQKAYKRRPESIDNPMKEAFRGLILDLRKAAQSMIKDRKLRLAMGAFFVLTFIAGSSYVLVIPIIQIELHSGAFSVGTLGGIFGVGMVAGSYLLGAFGHRIRKSTTIGIGTLAMALFMVINPIIQSFAAAAGLLFLAGIGMTAILISLNTFLHEYLPEDMRGRIFSTREWIFSVGFLISAGGFGYLSRFISARALLCGAGLFIFLLVLMAFILLTPRLKQKRFL